MLNQQQLQHFSRHGYCIAEGLLGGDDFAPVMRDCEAVLDALCEKLRGEGRLQNDHAGLPFVQRYLNISRDSGEVFAQHFTIALPPKTVRADTPIFLADSVFDLMRHAAILDAVEELIGGEIAASPVGNIRIKPPQEMMRCAARDEEREGLFRQTPWHQDNGVVTTEADAVPMITVWFSATDVAVEDGCLQVIAGSHKGGLLRHDIDHNGELFIPEERLSGEAKALPMRAGDVLFLHRRLCHASLQNRGGGIRWSFDLRYIPAGMASGRGLYPTVVVRSRARPDSVLGDAGVWRQMWLDARASVAGEEVASGSWHRWG